MGAAQSISEPYTLKTSKGDITGVQQFSSKTKQHVLNRYTHIPYALPPVGDLRWRRPQPIQSSNTDIVHASEAKRLPFSHTPGVELDHTTFGPISPQPEYNTNAAMVDNPNAAPPTAHVQDEDCLYLNVWTPPPSLQAPEGGWPIQFHIHGGWLQIGDALQGADSDPFELFSNSNLAPRIIVVPTYRLNILGFAAGKALSKTNAINGEKAGNFGLWDQRAALEWTYANISLFGGNPSKITVGGLSAGSHSAFLQLYHDTCLPEQQRIISQAYLWSNALIVQPSPATGDERTQQFDELCEVLGVDASLDDEEKVQKMRQVKWDSLVKSISKLKMHTFRSSTDGDVSDGGFISQDYLASLHDGRLATQLARRGVRVLIGEVRDEALLYKLVNPPNSRKDLVRQVGNYYPKSVVDALLGLDVYDVPPADSNESNITDEQWADIFAKVVADCQVHASLRGVVKCLLEPPASSDGEAVPKHNLFRYKIEWRAKGMDAYIKPEVGVCHAADSPIWWATGWRCGYDETDKKKAEAFLSSFQQFLAGESDIGWGDNKIDEYRLLDQEGNIFDNVKDQNWERGLKIWRTVWEAQK